MDRVYICLVGCVILSCNTWEKSKSNVKSIYFQKIRAYKKLKQVQNTKNRLKLFLKSFKI
jgi:hypothetical protein